MSEFPVSTPGGGAPGGGAAGGRNPGKRGRVWQGFFKINQNLPIKREDILPAISLCPRFLLAPGLPRLMTDTRVTPSRWLSAQAHKRMV
jgi:hypothetical protein